MKKPRKAKKGDIVSVYYMGMLEDGSIFDTNVEKGTLNFKIGEGRLLAGFEQGVLGMSEREQKMVEIPAGEGYHSGHLANKKLIFKIQLIKIK